MEKLNIVNAGRIGIVLVLILISVSQGILAQDSMLCRGHYWTEDEANLVMKKFAGEWNDRASWEKRAEVIRQGIIEGSRSPSCQKSKVISMPLSVNR